MIALLLLSVAEQLAALIVLAMFAYGAWIAHNLTLQERMPYPVIQCSWAYTGKTSPSPAAGDAVPLVGWYLPASGDNRCIIVIQGTDQHGSDPAIRALELGRDLVDRRFSVQLFNLRAQGESGGNRSSEGDREAGGTWWRPLITWRPGVFLWNASACWAFPPRGRSGHTGGSSGAPHPGHRERQRVHGLRLGHPPDSYQRMGVLPAVLVFVLHTLDWTHPLPDGLSAVASRGSDRSDSPADLLHPRTGRRGNLG